MTVKIFFNFFSAQENGSSTTPLASTYRLIDLPAYKYLQWYPNVLPFHCFQLSFSLYPFILYPAQ